MAVASESDGRRIELAARDTQLQHLTDKVNDLNKVRNDATHQTSQMAAEISALKRDLANEKKRAAKLDGKLTGLQATLIDREEKLERRERDLAKARQAIRVPGGLRNR